jgi:plasmid stabilization system protein ParE
MGVKLVQIHPQALAELKSALTWYLDRSETAAVKFVAELDRAIDLITESPKRWPAGEYSTRRFVLPRFPFAVIYREKETGLEVLAIAHGHRRPSYWKERL